MEYQLSENEVAWGVWDRLHLNALQLILQDDVATVIKIDSSGRSLIDKNFDVLRQALARANVDFGVSMRRKDGEIDVTLTGADWRELVSRGHRHYSCCEGEASLSQLPWYYSEWSQVVTDGTAAPVEAEEAAATRRYMLQPLRTLALAAVERLERVVKAHQEPTEGAGRSLRDEIQERLIAIRMDREVIIDSEVPIADKQFDDVWFTAAPADHAFLRSLPNGRASPMVINVGQCTMARFADIAQYASWLYASVAQICVDTLTALTGQSPSAYLSSSLLGAVISDARSRQQRAAAQQALPVPALEMSVPMAMPVMGSPSENGKSSAAQAVAALMERQRALANPLPPLALPLSITDHISVFAQSAVGLHPMKEMGIALDQLRREIEDFDSDLMWDVQPPTYLRCLAEALHK